MRCRDWLLPCEGLKVRPSGPWLFSAFAEALSVQAKDLLLEARETHCLLIKRGLQLPGWVICVETS